MTTRLGQLFCDKDGYADEMAFLSVAGVAVFLGLEIYSVLHGAVFDPQAFGIGLGSVIGAAAAGIGFKSRMERPQDGK